MERYNPKVVLIHRPDESLVDESYGSMCRKTPEIRRIIAEDRKAFKNLGAPIKGKYRIFRGTMQEAIDLGYVQEKVDINPMPSVNH